MTNSYDSCPLVAQLVASRSSTNKQRKPSAANTGSNEVIPNRRIGRAPTSLDKYPRGRPARHLEIDHVLFDRVIEFWIKVHRLLAARTFICG
jgi:hypothetical protein